MQNVLESRFGAIPSVYGYLLTALLSAGQSAAAIWGLALVGAWALTPALTLLFIVALSLTLLVLSAWYFWSLAHSFFWVSNKWPFK